MFEAELLYGFGDCDDLVINSFTDNIGCSNRTDGGKGGNSAGTNTVNGARDDGIRGIALTLVESILSPDSGLFWIFVLSETFPQLFGLSAMYISLHITLFLRAPEKRAGICSTRSF